MKNNLFVSNLHEDTTEDELRSHFGPIGTIESCKIATDKFGIISKGYGFVKYEKEEDAVKAVKELDMTELDGHVIRVDYARPSMRC